MLGELRVGDISATVEVMLNSGAMGMCYMDREFAKNLITFRNFMQKNEAGIPVCTSEVILNRQVFLNKIW